MICGVTSVSSCMDNISIRGGIIISLLGGVLYFIISKVYLKLEIDDPLESSILYGWMGVFSSIVVGFVDKKQGIIENLKFNQLAIQFIGMVSIIAFSATLTFILAVILKCHRRIRYGHIYEALGLNSLLNT